ncbi:MAG: hypothetical protein LBL46_00695, partial [Rickettsiales bacterium]|nr:hypothetical protein [Rickettsiales bacterium]
MKKILILLALAATTAPAAKLCVREVSGPRSVNTGNKLWAWGPGCKTPGGGSLDQIKYAAESAGTTPAGLCGNNIFVGGIGICSTSYYWDGANPMLDDGGEWCWCKTTYPIT